VEVLEVSVEKGFATSDLNGGTGSDTGVGYTDETWK
jgi:hypothetical protein